MWLFLLLLVVFVLNDMVFWMLDIVIEIWFFCENFDFLLNCIVLLLDKWLCVMVGDMLNVIIIVVELIFLDGKLEVFCEFLGYYDFGFVCDWVDDGWIIVMVF